MKKVSMQHLKKLLFVCVVSLPNSSFGAPVVRESQQPSTWFGKTRKSINKKNYGNHENLILQKQNPNYDIANQFRTYYPAKNKIPLPFNDTELFYGGTIRTDAYFVRNAQTLRSDRPDDAFDQFRQRSEFSFRGRHGIDHTDNKALLEGQMSFGNVMFWRTNQPVRYDIPVLADQNRIHWPVRLNLQESWFKINFDKLIKNSDSQYLSLKIGYFPFFIGRGISLGDWYNGGATIFGFSKTGVQKNAPKFPPGILLTGNVYQDVVDYDFYFSPAVTEEVNSGVTNSNYPSEPQYEAASDRHIVAGRLKVHYNFYQDSRTHFEPYFVYYNSPRNSIESPSGAEIRFTNFGMMVDHKIGGFEVNLEGARQFGRQKINERVRLDRPDVTKFIQVSGNTKSFNPLGDNSGGNLTNGASGVNLLRPSTELDPATTEYVSTNGTAVGTSTLDGTNYHRHPKSLQEWFKDTAGGFSDKQFYEYHPSYDLELAGYMFVADARYTFDDYPLQVSGSFGYFSGDKYPYNDDVNLFFADDTITTKPTKAPLEKRVTHFLPLRDYHYTGLWALPMVMFNAGVVPRPYDFSIAHRTTLNERDAATNLRYACGGMSFSPTDDLDKFKISANFCAYWTDSDLVKWDQNANLPSGIQMFEDERVAVSAPVAERNDAAKSYTPIQGWYTKEAASNFLGWEINAFLNYYLTDNLDLAVRAGIFLPGQLYKDLAGQPNENVDRERLSLETNGTIQQITQRPGLGSNNAYGINLRLRYTF